MGYADALAEREAKEREWLDGLKVGDAVIVNYSMSHSEHVVDHCTANFIHVGPRKYRRKSGYAAGKARGSITMPTQEIREELERERLVNKISGMRWDFVRKLTIDQLRRIAAILEEPADAATGKEASL